MCVIESPLGLQRVAPDAHHRAGRSFGSRNQARLPEKPAGIDTWLVRSTVNLYVMDNIVVLHARLDDLCRP